MYTNLRQLLRWGFRFDNVTADPGVGGAVFATDTIAGVEYPRTKVAWGADGVANDASAANPLPVVQTGAIPAGTNVIGHAIVDSGTITTVSAVTAITNALPSGANVIGHVLVDSGTITAVTAITNALPAGTNAIGKLSANSGVDIGDVDVTTVGTITPGVAATSLGKAEDGVHSDGDVGVMSLSVRKNTAVSTSGSDGDYQPLITDTDGKLWVNPTGGTNAASYTPVRLTDGVSFVDAATQYFEGDTDSSIRGTAVMWEDSGDTLRSASVAAPFPVTIVSGSSSGTEYTEDAVAAADPVGAAVILVRKDAPGATVTTDGDNIAQRGTNYGAAYVQVVSSSGSFVDTFGGGAQYTEDAAAAADPTGNAVILVRKDVPSTTVTTDGDNVAQRGTNYGAAYVTLLDTGGTPVSVGGGTQYTEDVASAADPIGNALIVIRNDARSGAITTTDGDNIALRGTNTGELYVKQTDVVPINDNSGSITVDYATTGSGNATGALRVELANNGTGVIATVGSVTSLTNPLPAGTNAIGKLAANSGVDIGDVDVTTVGTITPGVAATSLGKAEDGVHSDGDVGVMSLAVRKNTAASTSGADGDYQPLITNTTGHLWVDASGQSLTVGSHPVTNAGTFAVQATMAAGATTPSKAEDSASANADVGNATMAVRKATPANTSDTDGDYEMLQMSAGRLWTSATIDAAIPAGTNVIGHVIADTGSTTAVTQATGTNLHTVVDSGTITTVSTVTAVTAITNALPTGSNAIGKLAANSGVDIGDVDVTSILPGSSAANLGKAEDAAHTTGDVGVMMLAVRSNTAASLAASDGDYQPPITDTNGKLWVNPTGTTDAAAYLPVRVTDGSAFVAPGTEYSEGDTDASISGVAVLWEDAADTLRAVSAAKPLPVNIITGSSSGTEYTEDAAAAADPVGTAVNLIRKDTPAATVTTDGDNIAQRGSNYGAAYVTLLDSAGSFVSVGGGTQYTEDAAAAADPIGNALIVVRNDARSGSLTTTDGDNIALRGTNTGELYVKQTDAIPVTTIIPGAAATNLGKAEDAAHSSSDVGVMLLAVREAAATDLSAGGTDGDYEPLQVGATGRLWVDASGTTLTVGSHAVTNAGTFATQTTVAAGAATIAKAEDVLSVDGDVGVPAMAVQKATPANTAGTDGDYEMLQMSAGRLWTSAKIDTAIPAGTNVIGHVIVDTTSTTAVTQATGTNLHAVIDSGSVAVTNAGTFATQATISNGKTLKTASGTLTADTDVIAAVSTKRLKVQSYSLITTDNTGVLAIFKSNGTAGTELWRVYLKGPDANTPFGANLSCSCPAFLFATVAGEKLTLDVNSAATIHYSISYWDDDIT